MALWMMMFLATSTAARPPAPARSTTPRPVCTFPHAMNNTLCMGFSKLPRTLNTEAACAAACCAMPQCNHWQFGVSTPRTSFDGCWHWTSPEPPTCKPTAGWNGRSGRPYVPQPPQPPAHGPWKDPTLPIQTRLEDLLSRLSDEQLLAQLSNSAGAFLDQEQYEFGQECLAGFDGGGLWASTAVGLQTFKTSAFPHAVNLGMSFDKGLVRSVAAAIASEARAGHTHFNRPSLTCQSPVLNVARDPRLVQLHAVTRTRTRTRTRTLAQWVCSSSTAMATDSTVVLQHNSGCVSLVLLWRQTAL